MPKKSSNMQKVPRTRGQLKIGNQWNAITVLALSQTNPLKAIAEFIENSIDAEATHIQISRGRKNGEVYLRVSDNGRGVRRDETGAPDFHYVATHICDSIKRHLKENGQGSGLQGEFGIGLLGFWTLGEQLVMRSPGADGRIHQLSMQRTNPKFSITTARALLDDAMGTEILVKPLLPGLRQISGEKLQWYLAQELRNRLLAKKVRVTIHDLVSRRQFEVEPRYYEGNPLRIPPELTPARVEFELFGNSPDPKNQVCLYRRGTRVLPDVLELSEFQHSPWTDRFLVGHIECPDLQLNPGSRLGIVRDASFEEFVRNVTQVEGFLTDELKRYKQAEEAKVNRLTLQSIHKALEGAFSSLPPEEYDWFVPTRKRASNSRARGEEFSGLDPGVEEGGGTQTAAQSSEAQSAAESGVESPTPIHTEPDGQIPFFAIAGPLATVRIQPKSCILKTESERKLTAICKDRKGSPVTEDLMFEWSLLEGTALLENKSDQTLTLRAGTEIGLVRVQVRVQQREIVQTAEALITVAGELPGTQKPSGEGGRGLPTFTYSHCPGELWRSRFEEGHYMVIINSGHRDFIFSSRSQAMRLRYLIRLYTKEIILKNFHGIQALDAMDRLIEVSQLAEQSM